jgi:hypothetical protein
MLARSTVVMTMMDTIVFPKLLLGEQTPGVSRNCLFLAVHADDKQLTIRSHERCELTVP